MYIKLEVGEPWDFSGPDGKNVLFVESTNEGHGKYGDWVICTCKPFRLNETDITSLLLSMRHANDLLTHLKAKKAASMNAYWRKNGEAWQEDVVLNTEKDRTLIGGWLVVSGKVMDN